jgi:hypothetical protein
MHYLSINKELIYFAVIILLIQSVLTLLNPTSSMLITTMSIALNIANLILKNYAMSLTTLNYLLMLTLAFGVLGWGVITFNISALLYLASFYTSHE